MASQLPIGEVTLLFTDIEGSTRLLRDLGDAYADALAEHRRILREAVSAHAGAEVDTQGDAFFFAFARASEAVTAVVDAQRALAGGAVKVRMGLHTGEPRLTAEGYVGIDVHRAARIAAVGHGGQVLLSQATRALVEVRARDLGPHRLKDLSAPERIFQLEIEGLPSEFPPLRTVEAGSSNLPAPADLVRRPDGGAGLDRPPPRRPDLPPPHPRRPGWGRQDAPRPRGGLAAAGSLPARGPLRSARIGGLARPPAGGGGRSAPVQDRHGVQRLRGPTTAPGLPARADDAPRPRQHRAPRRGLAAPGRGHRGGARRHDAGDVARAPRHPERMGPRHRRAGGLGQR